MRNLRLVIVLLLVAFIMVPFSQAQSQDLEKTISAAVKFFGSAMGAGLYHSADVHGPLGLCLGVNGEQPLCIGCYIYPNLLRLTFDGDRLKLRKAARNKFLKLAGQIYKTELKSRPLPC